MSRTISTVAPDRSRKNARSSLAESGRHAERGDHRSRIVGGEGHVIEQRVRHRLRDGVSASDGGATRTPLASEPADRFGVRVGGVRVHGSTYRRLEAIEQHVLTVDPHADAQPLKDDARPFECVRGVPKCGPGIRHAVVEVMEAKRRRRRRRLPGQRRECRGRRPVAAAMLRLFDIQFAACVQSHHRVSHLGIEMNALPPRR